MLKLIPVLSLSALFVGCVPVAKYKAMQEDLSKSRLHALSLQHQSDSIQKTLQYYKSDLNNLAFEYDETQRFALFTDLELAAKLKQEKAEKEALQLLVQQEANQERYVNWLMDRRAEAFANEATCLFSNLTNRHVVVLKGNMVLVDLEEILHASKDNPMELKSTLLQLTSLVKEGKDWKMNICLGLNGAGADWHKVTLQNEMLGFLASEAALPTSRLAGVTHILNDRKLTEVQWNQVGASHLYIEMEFSVQG